MLFVWRWLLFLKGFGVVCPLTWVPNKIICFIQLYCSCRKGIPCHDQIVDGLLQNMPIGAGDRVLFLDLLPNRFLACVVKKVLFIHSLCLEANRLSVLTWIQSQLCEASGVWTSIDRAFFGWSED